VRKRHRLQHLRESRLLEQTIGEYLFWADQRTDIEQHAPQELIIFRKMKNREKIIRKIFNYLIYKNRRNYIFTFITESLLI
jgi:hypothetical protein